MRMLPLASASGPAIIGVVVIGAALFLSWLLRMDAGEEPKGAEVGAGRDGAPLNDGAPLDGSSRPGASDPA
jgi:hypothetical protein